MHILVLGHRARRARRDTRGHAVMGASRDTLGTGASDFVGVALFEYFGPVCASCCA